MSLLPRTLLIIAAALVALPAQAALIEYQFTGTVTATADGSTVSLGDSFSGYWRVEVPQTGAPFNASGFESRQYDLDSVRIELKGETAAMSGGFVSVSESVVDPAFLDFWPSGFASDYVASVVSSGLRRWEFDIGRTQIVFDYDGRGRWNEFALPGDYPFLDNALGSVIRMEDFISGGVIIGRIDAVTASTVPLPSNLLLLVSALPLLAAARRRVH